MFGKSPLLNKKWDTGWESHLPPRITPVLPCTVEVASALPRSSQAARSRPLRGAFKRHAAVPFGERSSGTQPGQQKLAFALLSLRGPFQSHGGGAPKAVSTLGSDPLVYHQTLPPPSRFGLLLPLLTSRVVGGISKGLTLGYTPKVIVLQVHRECHDDITLLASTKDLDDWSGWVFDGVELVEAIT